MDNCTERKLDIFFKTDMDSACILLTIRHYNKQGKYPNVADVCDFVQEVMNRDMAEYILGSLEESGYISAKKIKTNDISYTAFSIAERGEKLFESIVS